MKHWFQCREGGRRAQRGCAATEVGVISRKAAKAAKKNKQIFRALAGGISESEMFHLTENLRKPLKLSGIVVHAFSQTSLGRRASPVGEQPQPKAELSPAKAPRRKVDEPMPVIPGECEGSKKDFSLRSK
jgi:hypothetical protein